MKGVFSRVHPDSNHQQGSGLLNDPAGSYTPTIIGADCISDRSRSNQVQRLYARSEYLHAIVGSLYDEKEYNDDQHSGNIFDLTVMRIGFNSRK